MKRAFRAPRLTTVRVLEVLALGVWIGLATWLVFDSRQQGELVPLDVASLATGPSRERWYGIFMGEHHVGFNVTRTVATHTGGTLFEQRSSFRMVTMGQLHEVVTAGTALTDADGVLQRFDFFMSAGGAVGRMVNLAARGEVVEEAVVMEVHQAGEVNRLEIPLEDRPQVGLSLESQFARTEFVVGQTLNVPYFDPITLSQGNMVIRVVDVEVLAGGEEAYWLESSFHGLTTRSLVGAGGQMLRQEGAMGLALVRMSGEEARDVSSDGDFPDLIALTSVKLQGRIPKARTTRFLSLEVVGVSAARVVHNPPLQSVEGEVVTVDVPLRAELPSLAVRDESEPEWLAPSLTVPSAHPDIREAAERITAGAVDREAAVGLLMQWVYENVEKLPSVGVPNGLEVLRTLQGDCNEHTALFVSLARAAGIPARIAAGVVYSERLATLDGSTGTGVPGGGAFYYHAWPEVRLGGPTDWVPVDPTFGQFPADATHVKLVEGDLDRQVEIMGVMGRLGFKLVDVR
jgi:hypothetical protein